MVRVFEVGGCVRDFLLGIKSKDIDLVVTGLKDFDHLLKFLKEKNFKVFQENRQFLNVRAACPVLGPVDVAMPRAEANHDGRHASCEHADLKADLERRDFTVNAMARCVETGEVFDPHNGQTHLRQFKLQTVGNPHERFQEDGLRVLRALRFALTKDLSMSECLHEALTEFNPEEGLNKVSGDRMRDELAKMFAFNSLQAFLMLNKFSSLRDFVLSKVNLQPTLGSVRH